MPSHPGGSGIILTERGFHFVAPSVSGQVAISFNPVITLNNSRGSGTGGYITDEAKVELVRATRKASNLGDDLPSMETAINLISRELSTRTLEARATHMTALAAFMETNGAQFPLEARHQIALVVFSLRGSKGIWLHACDQRRYRRIYRG